MLRNSCSGTKKVANKSSRLNIANMQMTKPIKIQKLAIILQYIWNTLLTNDFSNVLVNT